MCGGVGVSKSSVIQFFLSVFKYLLLNTTSKMTEILIQQTSESERSLVERLTSLESNYEEYSGKVNNLNTNFEMNKGRIDIFGKELKILLAEINIIAEWIFDKFDVQLIDKQSFLFKHIQDYDEVEQISTNLSMAKYSKKMAKTFLQNVKRDSIETSDESEEELDDEPFMSSASDNCEDYEEGNGHTVPEEYVETMYEEEKEAGVQAEGSRPRRKTRRKINYKEPPVEQNEKEFSSLANLKKKLLLKKAKTPAILSGSKVYKKRGRKPGVKIAKLESTRAEIEIEATKVPKRGRPKKQPSEKIENWKNRLPVQCDECGKIFKGSGSLRTHKMIHLGTRPFDCKQCGKAFRRKHHLEFHLMVHAGDKKLQCRFCGKLFHIPRDLMRHERTHTGEKPYSCHLCPKTFNIKPHLTMHIRTHTGERPYKCNICEKCFSQSNSLRIHKKIHFKIPNPNLDTETKRRSKISGRSTIGSRKSKSIGSTIVSKQEVDFNTNENNNTELQQLGDSSNIIVDENLITSRAADPNLIIIPGNLNPSTHAPRKPDSQTIQVDSNYIDQDPNSSLQQHQNFFDPVQQAWRMAISQAQQSQTTSVIMNSRIDNHSGQIVQLRNSSDRILPLPNSVSSHASSTFSIPQFYDPNVRYFGP